MPALTGWHQAFPWPQAHGASGAAGDWPAVLLVVLVCAVAAAYGRGVQELWCRRGTGAVLARWRVVAFAAGLATLLLAQSPLVRPVAERSLTGHMGQHMLLLVVAGPLLAAGCAGLPLTVAAPARVRRWLARLRVTGAGRWLRRPAVLAIMAGIVHTVVLWSWHLPGLYLAAVDDEVVHVLEHASLLAAAWLLWSTVVGRGWSGRTAVAGPVLLVATGMPAAALGAVLTFAPVPLYAPRALSPVDPLGDQQLAGLVMWIPMDVVAGVVAVALFVRWLARLDRAIPAGRDQLPPEPLPAGTEEVRAS